MCNCYLRNVEVSDSVENIGYYAFYACINLESVKIPENVTNIEKDVFEECPKDLLIICEENSLARIYANENNIMSANKKYENIIMGKAGTLIWLADNAIYELLNYITY